MKINNLAEAYGQFLHNGEQDKADQAMACAQKVLRIVIPVLDQIPASVVEAGLTGPEAMQFYEANASVPAFSAALRQAKEGLADLFPPSLLH